MIIGLK